MRYKQFTLSDGRIYQVDFNEMRYRYAHWLKDGYNFLFFKRVCWYYKHPDITFKR